MINIKTEISERSEHINEKCDGPYHGFGYLSLFSDPLDLTRCCQHGYQD